MAWTAAVTSKSFVNGFYVVNVRYTDGMRNIDETYRAQVPKATWIPDQVRSRLAQIETASAFDITIGPVIPSTSTFDPNLGLFGQRVKMLEVAKILIDLGVIQASNAKVVALATWIRSNFDTYIEQIDLWR
jgi:hypothetical protein